MISSTVVSAHQTVKMAFLTQILLSVLFLISQSSAKSTRAFTFNSDEFSIDIDSNEGNLLYRVNKFDKIMQEVQFGFDTNFSINNVGKDGFSVRESEQDISFEAVISTADFTMIQVSRKLNKSQRAMDCFELETGRVHWYGGPQIDDQYWPIEKSILEEFPYVSKLNYNAVVPERYWLNSVGGFVYIHGSAPLFYSQNIHGNTMCFAVENKLPYNTRRDSFHFVYYLGFARDARAAHFQAVDFFLNKPTDVPDRRMVEHPIWSTWAKYKKDINESTVETFASEIINNGFNNSQLEIDDDWEICYGALTFRDSKFKNIREQTDNLRAQGFRVTLWVHPFINKGCEPWYSEAKENGYLVVDHDGNPDTQWWNSENGQAAHIDFTKSAAAEWYTDRLKALQLVYGIDGFKFDAGETIYFPVDTKLNASIVDHPNALIEAYLRTVAQFGPLTEVRAAQGTQDLPIFVRMLDKHSVWNYNRGVPTLITTLFQLNMVGYGFVLPDMIGGNGYFGNYPSRELFIRWLQATVFMPSLQFSYVPWDYDQETIEISRLYTDLHAEYAEEIMRILRRAVETGEPVNPPIWWVDPKDQVALGISDEFMLGDRILSAPVVEKEATYRHVYLPKGEWFDPNLNKTYAGPIWLMEYPAPLNVLPYFIRQNLEMSFV